MVNNHESTVATRMVIESIKKTGTKLEPIILPATTPHTIGEGIDQLNMSGDCVDISPRRTPRRS